MSTEIFQGTLSHLLLAVEARVKEKVPGMNEATCFLSDGPLPMEFPAGTVLCTVCHGEGQFDEAAWSGGGQLVVTVPVYTTLLVYSLLDTPPRAKMALVDPNVGILTQYLPPVLQCLAYECAEIDDPPVPWQPQYEGEDILLDAFVPHGFTAPAYLDGLPGDRTYLYSTVTFVATFDWNLTV